MRFKGNGVLITYPENLEFDFRLVYNDALEERLYDAGKFGGDLPPLEYHKTIEYKEATQHVLDILCRGVSAYIKSNVEIRQIMSKMPPNQRQFDVTKLTLSMGDGYLEYSATLQLSDGVNTNQSPASYSISATTPEDEKTPATYKLKRTR
ncbi:hypothetical protein SCHPADRAFT_887793 [Schizopora paradoxa]|uniref:Uncharacterized protein n=1 Tax=Schizopora paradoxa TaxID=27342 RepID=A0A0H2S444_9AGAM|nr:hypothetical protein SCHPADRAFT_887793 [Schizopora paradoxa]